MIITPEYQRAFRWDTKRQTDFIETILLGLPFPSIFVAANEDGKWELIDGLQRVSTILSFFGVLNDLNGDVSRKNKLDLDEGSLIKELSGLNIDNIPLSLKLQIKRTPCRVEIIQRDSEFNMRYELFKRLNTGGEGLSRQEIRNCIYRGYDNTFNQFIKRIGSEKIFREMIHISESQIEEMYYDELALRFIALKNSPTNYKHSNIQDFLDAYMREESINPNIERYKQETALILEILSYLKIIDEEIFKLSRQNFSTSVYDAVMLSFAQHESTYRSISSSDMGERINRMKESEEFRQFTGSASSSGYRISNKLDVANKLLFDSK